MSKTYKDLVAQDGFELGTSRNITPEGFLEAPAIIARAGVQLYRARELGLDKHGVPPDTIVRLHRPMEELFDPNVIAAFDAKPVMIEPHKTVTADNWKELSVGDIHGPERSGDNLAVKKIIIRDKAAVDTVMGGKKYMSIGYKFDVDMTPGTTAQGQQYDGLQRNIQPNHVVITSNPRGGFGMTIADSATVEHKEKKMRKVTVNGVPVECGDTEAGIIDALIAERDAARNQQPSITYKLGDASKTITGGDAIVKELQTRDTEIASLKAAQLTDAQIEERVNARVLVIGDASKLVADYDAKGKSNKQIHQEVLTAVVAGDAAHKAVVEAILSGKTIGDASDEALAIAFKAVAAQKTVTAVKDVNAGDAAVAAALTTKREPVNAGDAVKPTGRDGFNSRSNNAWRGEVAK